MTKVLELTNGAQVKVKKVSPMLFNVVSGKLLEEPSFPIVEEQSAAGGKQALPAMEGTPEHEEYKKAWKEYRKKLQIENIKFHTNAGIVAWKFEDEDWQTDVPEDWELPASLTMYGVTAESPTDRRYFFIVTELLGNPKDEETVDRVILSQEPVTNEEVKAALSPFDSKEL